MLSNWLRTKKEYRELESIEAVKLNSYLAEFLLLPRKSDKNLPLNDPARQHEGKYSAFAKIYAINAKSIKRCH